MNKNRNMIIIGIIAFVLIISGISYSYFVYNKDIGNVSLESGEISISLSDVSNDQTLTNVIPKSDNEGKISPDYIDFTVDGTVDSEKIYYEVYIMPDSNNTIDTDYIKTYLTDQEDNVIKGVTLYDSLQNSEITGGKRLYRAVIELNNDYSKKTYSKEFRLRVWLDENYTGTTAKTFDFDINLYAKNVEESYRIPEGAVLLRNAIEEKEAQGGSCSNITFEEDGITYFSGTNACIDMNYVWYSGKLWRITAIYPDGAMKLITENCITSIGFNDSTVDFYTDESTTSYMYQWLNEDFYDTLYNPTSFIDTTKRWNATNSNESGINVKLTETTMITANVGLLNSYEYYNSYRNTDYTHGYLNIWYYWWLLNPYSSSKNWRVKDSGDGSNSLPTYPYGIRPSIYLKSGLEFVGDGTTGSPYKIIGDKNTGTANELINTRLSGEYVKLKNGNNEQVFRIIGVEDNKTKIIATNYVDNKAEKKFATSTGSANTLWGTGTTIDEGTWYIYLNSTYYPDLINKYGNIFDSETYYLGTSGYNYKLTVCANTTSGNTKVCDKTTDKGTFNIGLPRYGEMFAVQQTGGYSSATGMWLINRYSVTQIMYLFPNNYGDYGNPTYSYAARPTVHLKSTVKILSGSGTENDPYVVGL